MGSYDPECEKLARHFLNDSGGLSQADIDYQAHQLAQDIQDAVEAFFAAHPNRNGSDTP